MKWWFKVRYFEVSEDGLIHGALVWRSVSENVDAVVEAASRGRIFGVRPPFSDSDWYGARIDTWGQLKKMTMDSWEEGMRVVERLRKQIRPSDLPSPRAIIRKPAWLESPGEMDLERYLDGVPFNRSTAKREGMGSQFVSLAVDVGGNANVSPERLFWRGAVASLVAEILDAAGYSTEIWCVDQTTNSHRGLDLITNFVLIKQGDAPTNLAAIVNSVSPWYYRTVAFASMSFASRDIYSIGSARKPKESHIQMIDPCGRSAMIRGCDDYDSAVAVAKKVLEEFGGSVAV